MIGLLGIINACYGTGVHKDENWLLGKWLYPALVWAVVYLETADMLFSLMWAVAFILIRFTELSGKGFGVFSWERYRWTPHGWEVFCEAARFLLTRATLVSAAAAVSYVTTHYAPLPYVMLAALTYGIPYIIIGRICGEQFSIRGKLHGTPRLAEYVSGALIGLMIYLSWRML